MNIVQISTYDVIGGAGRAAYRLHCGLREIGHRSRMLVREKASDDPDVFCPSVITPPKNDQEHIFYFEAIQRGYIDWNRTDVSNTMFSLPFPGHDLSSFPVLAEADIINLHWITGFQSIQTLKKLFSLQKPIVWTLHDMWPFTGGCHYSAGCQQYCQDCCACPQLCEDPLGLTKTILQDKLTHLKGSNLVVVTPSRWMADCAKESALFRGSRVEVIPNSLETDVFFPFPKAEAKRILGFEEETTIVLFGCQYFQEKRKGFSELLSALSDCLDHLEFHELVKKDKLKVLTFGSPIDDLNRLGIPIVSLGTLASDEEIRTAYCGADLFVLPSLEDNLPNTILEAMACGTSVVAFDTGGIRDMVEDSVNGFLVPTGDTKALAQRILCLVFDTDKRNHFGSRSREKVEMHHTLAAQAKGYLSIYQELYDEIDGARNEGFQGRSVNSQPDKEETLSYDVKVPMDIEVGPEIGSIYESLVLKSLQKFAPFLKEQLEETEKDRAARLEQVNELTRLLAESETDREARLEQIRELTKIARKGQETIQRLEHRIHKLENEIREYQDNMETLEHIIHGLRGTLPMRIARKVSFGRFDPPNKW
ncbi:MAG: glycosyltransferase [Deltaproteobacteria bacterium]|nr:glycosyltransferase [Deltaproteobacteria bacterium]